MYDYYNRMKTFYVCPLGEAKHEVDSLKYKEENLKMLDIIETNIEDVIAKKKIAEDDEFEYYTEE
jgi:hypothetical protein